jgi:cation diffusion facilitator family transporter
MNREKEIYKVTLVGSAGNAALCAFKFIAGIVGNSAAMMADAVHSLSDFVTDVLVIVFVRISSKPQDQTHDYGHGKFETMASFLIALALVAAAACIVVSGVLKLLSWLGGAQLESPGWIAFWAALLSIVVKELLYRYTAQKGRALHSQVMVANAWHHRSDALSSIGTAVGIGGAVFMGPRWTILDPIASVVVGAFIIKVAFDLLKNGFGDLMEQSLPDSVENEILELVATVPGVSDPHNLKTRRIGNHYAIELHIRMDGHITLNEAHDKASEVEQLLRQRYGEETHVAVHAEPEKENSLRPNL